MVLSAQEAGSTTFPRTWTLKSVFDRSCRKPLQCHSHPAKTLKGVVSGLSRRLLQGATVARSTCRIQCSLLLGHSLRQCGPSDATRLRLQERDIEHLERWVQGCHGHPKPAAWQSVKSENPSTWKRRSNTGEPVQPSQPPSSGAQWVKQPIDAFLKHRLEEEGLGRHRGLLSRLLRRVHVVLTGLPPTQAALDAFLQDKGMDAKKKVIALLGSIHYGSIGRVTGWIWCAMRRPWV